MLTGFTSRDKLQRDNLKVEPTTVQPITSLFHGPNVLAHCGMMALTSSATTLSATTTDLKTLNFTPSLANPLMRGDFIKLSGAYNGYYLPILSGTTSSCVLAVDLPENLASGTSISLVRPVPLSVGTGGITSTNIAEVGGVSFAQGQRAVASSISVTLAASHPNLNCNNFDGNGNKLASSATPPVGNEQALITRNIPSGFQGVLIDGLTCVGQDLLWTFETGMFCLGYDINAGTFGPIPLTNSGTAIPVDIPNGAVMYAYGYRDDTSPGTQGEDSYGPIRITQYRAAHSNLRDTSGNEIGSGTSAPGSAARGLTVRNINAGPASSSVGSASVTTSATTVIASNSERRGFTILLDPAATDSVYVKFGSSASSTDFNIFLPKGSYTPFVAGPGCYTGIITAVSASGTQTVRYWEGTP